jgi:hypothetical protein
MVESSFSPVAGAEAGDEPQGLRPGWLGPATRTVVRGAHLGFSQYVSSRTVLAGGCPAVNDQAVARAPRRMPTGRA